MCWLILALRREEKTRGTSLNSLLFENFYIESVDESFS